MVQRKVPNKLGIKPIHLKSDTKLVNLIKPSSPQTHEKLNKIMKKSRPIKRTDESRSLTPFKKKKTQPMDHNEPRSTPNYMKSTSCFEARKEQSPKTPTASKNSKTNGSKTSSLKTVRSLTKTTSFKPLRPSKKVVLCEDLDANRATCSSTLKESKFPSFLELGPGGTELDGKSAMKVCPYTYCSLNGHHHAPVPPLKCFLSARRRAMKTQKGFKLGCLSPRVKTPVSTKTDIKEAVMLKEVDMKTTRVIEEEEEKSRDFFVEINGCQDLECSDIDWEEGYCSESCNDDVREEKIQKTVDEKLYGELQELYDEESVTSGAWSDEEGDSESDGSYSFQQMEINQDFMNYDSSDVSSRVTETELNDKIDEFEGFNILIGDQNVKYSIDYQQEEIPQESKTIPDFEKEGNEKNHTTIIYNIIQFNISIFINGEKTETDKVVTNVTENKMEKEEIIEEQGMSNGFNEEIDKEPASRSESDEEQTNSPGDKDIDTNSICKKSDFNEEKPDSCINFKGLTTGVKKSGEEMDDDSREFNPRGPNFLAEVVGPDAETVDLRHQSMDERKNAEEWMVDFALQQAVNTIAPKRKKKVALLVEAFEKVMPIPKYETNNRYSSKGFTNARPMQTCS